jgi:predicted TIM-barrel fold metal-dependent hydrolase
MSLDPTSTSDEEIDHLHDAGVRGARLHRMAWGHGHQAGSQELIGQIRSISDKTARKRWVIGIFTDVRTWAGMADFIRNELDPRVRMIADHFGGTFPGEEDLPEFAIFLDLIREKKVWVKVSGFERLYHGTEKGMAAIEPIAKRVIEAGPDQIVYGSDWPHTQLGVARKGRTDKQRLEEVEGFRDVDDLNHIKTLRKWIGDDETWHKLFVTNPEKLFK